MKFQFEVLGYPLLHPIVIRKLSKYTQRLTKCLPIWKVRVHLDAEEGLFEDLADCVLDGHLWVDRQTSLEGFFEKPEGVEDTKRNI